MGEYSSSTTCTADPSTPVAATITRRGAPSSASQNRGSFDQ
jgi:hypothetical protein